MNIREHELQSIQSDCLTAVRQLAGRFGWHVLSEEDWVAEAVHLCMTPSDMKPFEACLNVYARAMYDACRNSRDAPRQAQAYTELHYYLFQKARRRCPAGLVEDATQTALMLVVEKIGTCRDPGAFLAFAFNWLLAAIKTVLRSYPPGTTTGEGDGDSWVDDEFADLLDDLLKVDSLKGCIGEMQQQHPRAHDQLNAVLWKYFGGFSDQEIAEFLHTTVGHVYVLRHRAMTKLRECIER